MFRKIAFYFFIFLTILFYLSSLNSNIIKFIDYKIYDIFSFYFEKNFSNKKSNVVLIDIDEKSIKKLGQWPWPRVVMADLINRLSFLYPAAIGMDIFFPNEDRTSPIVLENFYKKFFNLNTKILNIPFYLKNNDKIFSNAVKQSNTILPVLLQKGGECNLKEFGFHSSLIKTSYNCSSVFCNYKPIQNSLKYFGFINSFLDSDGIFRRVPLFANYRENLIPFFPLAILMSIEKPLVKGNNEFVILGHKVRMNEDGEVLLNFHTPYSKILSAIDILNNNFNKKDITGKIVVIGSLAIGLNNPYINSFYKKLSSLKITSTFIDNLLNDALLIQPEYLKFVNICLSFTLSFLILWFLFKRWYIGILSLFLVSFLISFVWLWYEFSNGVYVSIGYFWVPLFSYFFFISLFFSVVNHLEKRKFYGELEKSHSAALESITLVAAMRDDETGSHLIRTKKYIKILAEYLYKKGYYKKYLNPKFIRLLYEAAPLHDIGKVAISDNILKKKGKFTKEEYEIMKKHTVLGKEMIEKAMNIYNKNEFLQIACSIAYYHHERWDGSGYPQGLKGDEIPIEGQLMAIADVYDALISKRVYKEAYSYQEAENFIISERGKGFNPVIVDAFSVLRYEFRKIASEYKEEERRQQESIKKRDTHLFELKV